MNLKEYFERLIAPKRMQYYYIGKAKDFNYHNILVAQEQKIQLPKIEVGSKYV